MTVTGLPRPLPECQRCATPMPRPVWRLRRVCEACATTAERLAATHRAAELQRAAAATTRTTHARIEALAARRAARTTPAQEAHPA